MNAINNAISNVYFSIPFDILNIAFNSDSAKFNQSMDEVIMSKVIRPKVLVDCNLVGGVEVYIDVGRCSVSDFSTPTSLEYIIDVPKILTNDRSIITALGLFSSVSNINGGFAGRSANSNPMLPQLTKMMNGVSPTMAISTALLEIVGENKVVVTDPSGIFINGLLKCVVENDSNLSNISPRSYPAFTELVILCVKAYIHNTLIVKLGKGFIYNGHELGIVTDLINDYGTAYEDYKLYLRDVWGKVAFHNDKDRLNNHIYGMF